MKRYVTKLTIERLNKKEEGVLIMKTTILNSKNLTASAVIYMAFILLTAIHIHAEDTRVLSERTLQTQNGRNLYLNTPSGDIYISTWDKPEVYVKVLGNRSAEKKIKFRFENTEDGVRLTAKNDSWVRWLFWSNVYLRYEIKVPAAYSAYVNTAGGNIKLAGLAGSAKLETSGGDVTLLNSRGKIYLSTSGGDIKMDNAGGELRATTSGGDINASNFTGDLNVSTSGGDIHLDGRSGQIKASTSGGDIYLNYKDDNRGIYLETSGGDIVVKVPQNFSASADLSTTGGEVTCDLPITRNGKMTSSKVKGELNGGGRPLNCSSTGGDIKVLR